MSKLEKIPLQIIKIVFFVALIINLSACYPTQFMTREQHLLHKNEVKFDRKPETDLDGLENYIYLKPNRNVLGFIKFHLGVYVLFEMGSFNKDCGERIDKWKQAKVKDEYRKQRGDKLWKEKFKTTIKHPRQWLSTKICLTRKWIMETIGEAPVMVDNNKIVRSKKALSFYLHNKGYLNARVDTASIFLSRKRMDIQYNIKLNQAFYINNYNFSANDPVLDTLMQHSANKSKVKKGQIFDLKNLSAERERLTRLFQDNGYYKFTKDYIVFKADTGHVKGKYYINIRLEVMKIKQKKKIGEYFRAQDINHEQFGIRNIYINPDYDLRTSIKKDIKADTIYYKGYYFIFQYEGNFTHRDTNELLNTLPLKADRLIKQIYVGDNPERIYKISNVEQSLRHFNSLKIFRLNSIDFTPVYTYKKQKYKPLDCYIMLKPTTKQSYTIELEGSNFSSNFGMAGNFIYEHRNLFRSATRFALKLKGAREKRLDILGETGNNFNTQEYQAEFRFTFPQLSPELIFKRRNDLINKIFNPKTTVSFSYLFRERPDYTLNNLSFLYGYFWRSGKKITHYFNPLELSRVNLSNISDNFILFLKNNPQLQASYEDHFIAETSYSFVYNPQNRSHNKNFSYIRASIESAGNTVSLAKLLFKKAKPQEGYKILQKSYSEFVKVDLDYRYFIQLSKRSKIALRNFMGIGYAFYNSSSMPFGKLYYSGGANSLRAWQIRTLGPGSYRDTLSLIPNQTGDLKLEWNAEYRYKLFWVIESAFFLDVGNIWNIHYNENVQGGQFKWNTFAKQLAVGTGLGFRFDFSFFIFRTDLGLKLRDPAILGNNKWIYGVRPFDYKQDVNLSLSIGYPF